jgi:hypothetical protein
MISLIKVQTAASISECFGLHGIDPHDAGPGAALHPCIPGAVVADL